MSLKKEEKLKNYLSKNYLLKKFIKRLNSQEQECVASIVFIDQQDIVFANLSDDESSFNNFKELVKNLVNIDLFFCEPWWNSRLS